jgi:hypothetical protein
MKKENYLDDELALTKADIIEEIISNNYYMVDAIRKDDQQEVMKRHILIDNLIKIYLK